MPDNNLNIINKTQLESIILEEIKKSNIPLKLLVNIYYPKELDSKTYDKNNSSIFIQIDIESNENTNNNNKKKNNNNNHNIEYQKTYYQSILDISYLDFYYVPKDKLIEHININLIETLRNKGYGSKLIKTIENIGRKLECNISRVNFNTNKDFWTYMGYEINGLYWDKKI